MAKLTDLIRPAVRERAIVGLTGGGPTKLDGIATVGMALSPVPFVMFSLGGAMQAYILRAGTDAEASPGIIRPDDYAGGTNEKVWQLVAVAVFPLWAVDGFSPIPYSFASNHDTGIWHDNSAPESINVTINNSDVVSFIDGQILLVDGVVGAPAFAFNSDSTSGMYLGAGPSVNFAVGGAAALKLKQLEVRIGAGVGFATDANANAIAGNAVLVAGTKHISNTNVATTAVIILTRKTAGGTIGDLTYTIDGGGGGFTINSANGADTSTVSYLIINVN
jgi:hypothetical protein